MIGRLKTFCPNVGEAKSLIYYVTLDDRYLPLFHHSYRWNQQSCTLLRHYRMYSDVIIFYYCVRFNKDVRLLLLTLTTTHPRLSVFRTEPKSKRCVAVINMQKYITHIHFFRDVIMLSFRMQPIGRGFTKW